MPLTPYGLREWLIITVLGAAAAIPCALLQWWWGLGISVLAWLALVSFFRDPIRRVPADLPDGAMVSPADGAISAVLEVDHHPAVGGPAVIVRIFLSVLNVHVNRAPCAGTVGALEHTPGRYLDARRPESAQANESNLMTLRTDHDRLVGVRQVSGAIARRIVCPVSVGDRLDRGQKYGMIKFGSTTELILARSDDPKVHVAEGDKVKAGLTVLATVG